MGVENCCLRPEEKKEEIIQSNLLRVEKNSSFPHDSEQIKNIETNNQLQSQEINQEENQQISADKEGNIHEISLNEKEKNENAENYQNQQGEDFQKQNEENEEQAEEQMEEHVQELGEEGDEEEGQVVEVHEEIEIEDVTPAKEGANFEEINPLDQLGETVVKTTYINDPNNINNNNYTQQQLNDILIGEGNNFSKPANSYMDYNNQNVQFVSTASAEGAFDLNNIQIQPNENDMNSQHVNFYGMDSGAQVPINNVDLNTLLKNDNNANANFDINVGQSTGNFDLNNLNVDSSNNNVGNVQYNLESQINYNNELNSLPIQDSNIVSGVNYSIAANPLISTMTFGVQNEGNNYENVQVFKSEVGGSSYIDPVQSASYNYSYSEPAKFNSTQY